MQGRARNVMDEVYNAVLIADGVLPFGGQGLPRYGLLIQQGVAASWENRLPQGDELRPKCLGTSSFKQRFTDGRGCVPAGPSLTE